MRRRRRSSPFLRAVKKEAKAWGKHIYRGGRREAKGFAKAGARAGFFLLTGRDFKRRR